MNGACSAMGKLNALRCRVKDAPSLAPASIFDDHRTMKPITAVVRLSALAQESRLAVFRLLVQAGPEGLCVRDIGAKLNIAPPTLSFHLKELVHAGLLKARQQSRFIFYAPDFKAMNDLVAYLTENCCGGQACGVAAKGCAPKAPRESRAA